MRCPQPNELYRPFGDLVSFQSGPTETYYFTLTCTTDFGSFYGLNDEQTGLSVRSYATTTGPDDPDRGNIGECMSICDAYNRQKDVEDGAGRAAVGEGAFEGSMAFLRVQEGEVGGRQVCAVEGLQDAFN
ncbi:unnamed protein product [Zymoseptoria tritici ST99CH_1E4]|uniref:Uncharacterized protein n=1 Tax=Zymoseptoria tritici ST99CH_1E4 TaxID=1276532 RepID=A0A2H1GUH8_ZYMTR|nr:unnamed protein product [Zymoseptoria tritici ST99CH_1E4]